MDKKEVIFAVLFFTTVLVLLAFFLLFFLVRYRYKSNAYIRERERLKKDYEQALMQARIEVQENTLLSLGYELHDNIGQLLSAAKMYLNTFKYKMHDVPPLLTATEETLQKAITEVRSLSRSVDKEWLQQFSIIENLRTEVKRINASQAMQISFTHPDKIFISPDKQIILFRIIQEALQNGIKHSLAKNFCIDFRAADNNLLIKIIDNGKGFDYTLEPQTGSGLKNMKHRTKLLGGTIEWKLLPERGMAVIIDLPETNKQ